MLMFAVEKSALHHVPPALQWSEGLPSEAVAGSTAGAGKSSLITVLFCLEL